MDMVAVIRLSLTANKTSFDISAFTKALISVKSSRDTTIVTTRTTIAARTPVVAHLNTFSLPIPFKILDISFFLRGRLHCHVVGAGINTQGLRVVTETALGYLLALYLLALMPQVADSFYSGKGADTGAGDAEQYQWFTSSVCGFVYSIHSAVRKCTAGNQQYVTMVYQFLCIG